MRLIDADALIQKRNHAKAYAPDMYVIGQGYVMDAPTIDAVPVVRCGDCIYYDANYCKCNLHSEEPDQYSTGINVEMDSNDYCSYGERKESKVKE